MADHRHSDNPSSQAAPDDPFDFSLASLTPHRLTLSHFERSGQFHLLILNKRNRSLRLHLSGLDHTGQCRFEFLTSTKNDESAAFRLPPGRTVIPIRVTPPPRRLFSFGKCVYHLTIVARPRDGVQTARLSRGHLHSPPWLGPTTLTVIALCLLILGGVLFSLQSALTDQTGPPALSIKFVTVTPTPPAAAAQPVPPSESPTTSEPRAHPQIPYEQIFREVAAQYGLDWQMLAMQAYSESRFDPYAVGIHNDKGLMQLIPSTWNEWAPRVGVTDPFDPYSNVLVGAAYMAFLRDYFAERGYHDDYWVLVAYNWGPYNLELFLENNGRWAEVPYISRHYALEILQASPEANFSWADLEALNY